VARSWAATHRGQGGEGATDDVEDRRASGHHGEHRGGTFVVEPSRGVVAELGGGAQRERWGLHDSGDDTEDGWDGRWAPRCRGERQSDTVMVEPWRAIAAWSWWSAVAALGCAELDEWIRFRACDKRIQVFGYWTLWPTNGRRPGRRRPKRTP
jgi:hypothetical protein